TVVWLRCTDSNPQACERKSERWIFSGGESYQSFRSVSHIPGSAAENRLDDDGGILSPSAAGILFTRDRCVPGGTGSRRPQNDSYRDRAAEERTHRRIISRGRNS